MTLLSSSPAPGGRQSYLKRVFLAGFAVIVPVVLTLFVVSLAVDFLSGFLAPAVFVAQESLGYTSVPVGVIQLVAAGLFVFVVFLVGIVAESERDTEHIERRVENLIAAIPGVGSIYSNIDEMSELLLEQDTESFQEVKLVEFPKEQSYMLGFLTASEPTVVEETVDEDLTTLFAPMGPNPFMGGFVLHVESDRIHDIDMSVEEGLQAIVSSGVTVNEPGTVPDANVPQDASNVPTEQHPDDTAGSDSE